MGKRKTTSGFTIIELLIVVIVIAILTAISIITYNRVQARAINAKIISNVHSYYNVIQLYKAQDGYRYPSVPNENPTQVSMVCLGIGYPNGGCGKVTGVNIYESQAFNNKLKSVSGNQDVVNLTFGAVQGENFIGAVYGIDSVGPPAPHTGYGRVIEWFLIGENQDCSVSGAYGYATGNGNTACELFLEPTG